MKLLPYLMAYKDALMLYKPFSCDYVLLNLDCI